MNLYWMMQTGSQRWRNSTTINRYDLRSSRLWTPSRYRTGHHRVATWRAGPLRPSNNWGKARPRAKHRDTEFIISNHRIQFDKTFDAEQPAAVQNRLLRHRELFHLSVKPFSTLSLQQNKTYLCKILNLQQRYHCDLLSP